MAVKKKGIRITQEEAAKLADDALELFQTIRDDLEDGRVDLNEVVELVAKVGQFASSLIKALKKD